MKQYQTYQARNAVKAAQVTNHIKAGQAIVLKELITRLGG